MFYAVLDDRDGCLLFNHDAMKKLIGILILVIVFGGLSVSLYVEYGVEGLLAIAAGFALAALVVYATYLITGEDGE